MNRSLLSRITWSVTTIATMVSLGACGIASSTQPATRSTSSSASPAGPRYSTKYFTTPVDVIVPSWLEPTPTDDTAHFVTFGSSDGNRALRILSPVVVYPPGSSTTAPIPEDYVSYLLGQAADGGHLTDRDDTKVDGHDAVVVTATTNRSLDGSLGCPQTDITPADCFGLQRDLVLRIAVVTTNQGPLLIWLRNSLDNNPDMKAESERFDQFLSGVHFSGRSAQAVPSSAVATPLGGSATAPGASAARTPFDGTYRMDTPADCDPAPENCGTFTFVFDRGWFAITQENRQVACTWAYGTYTVNGDRVEWLFTAGGGNAPTGAQNKPGEDFVFTWSLVKDRMTLEALSPPDLHFPPWRRLAARPQPSYLSTRCPPPADALPG